jgi:REP element-mobilizing transposase RayT
MVEIAYSQQSVGESNHHLQFTPKYRRCVFLDEKIRATCERLAYEKAKQLGVSIGAINFGPDHFNTKIYEDTCLSGE